MGPIGSHMAMHAWTLTGGSTFFKIAQHDMIHVYLDKRCWTM